MYTCCTSGCVTVTELLLVQSDLSQVSHAVKSVSNLLQTCARRGALRQAKGTATCET